MIKMSFHYVEQKIMKELDCSKNPTLCRLILEHDPGMISQMYNTSYELVEKHIIDSTTFLKRLYLPRMKESKDILKVLKLAYAKDKRSRIDIMHMIYYVFDDEVNHYVFDDEVNSKDDFIKPIYEKSSTLIEKMILDFPETLLLINTNQIDEFLTKFNIDVEKLYSKINFGKILTRFKKHKNIKIVERIINQNGIHWWFRKSVFATTADNFLSNTTNLYLKHPELKDLEKFLFFLKIN
jgi:hypothetical protein